MPTCFLNYSKGNKTMSDNIKTVGDYKDLEIPEDTFVRIYSDAIKATVYGKGIRVFSERKIGAIYAYKYILHDEEDVIQIFSDEPKLTGIQLTDECHLMTQDEIDDLIIDVI
jgi:hypothetical protein